ncbi:MAG: M23 family metallopeptidase [Fusobacteriota bacterium]
MKIRKYILIFLILISTNIFAFNGNSIQINKERYFQGEIVKILGNNEIENMQVEFLGNKYKFQNEEDKNILLIPISYWTNIGEYNINLINKDKVIFSEKLQVESGNFDKSYLKVSKENEEKVRPVNKENQKRKSNDKKLVYSARQKSSNKRLWKENFIWPLEGIITTKFGATRYHNNKLANRHNGIDIAAPKGTPIKATNTGEISLSADLLRTGNTVIIDHGWDIYSSYLHLSELLVEEGDFVKKGDIIGYVGSTGFSTGPHLHWSISIGRVFIDPNSIIDLEI